MIPLFWELDYKELMTVASDEDGDILQGSQSAHTYPTRCICALWAAWMNWKYHIAQVLLYSESISSLLVGEFSSNNGIPSGIWVEGECASWRRLGAKESDRRDMKEGNYEEPGYPFLSVCVGGRCCKQSQDTPGGMGSQVHELCHLWHQDCWDWWTYSWSQVQRECAIYALWSTELGETQIFR